MRVLLIHRYFWPDATPYAHMLLDIARRLQQAGHEVQVLSTFPSYRDDPEVSDQPAREVIDGVKVRRLSLFPERKRQTFRRALNANLFLAKVARHLIRHRYDLVTFSTMPPVLLGVVVRLALGLCGSRGRYLYHCQDIYPELALHAGIVGAGPWYRWLRAMDRKTCRDAAAVVVLSADMSRTIKLRLLDDANVHVINNFSLAESEVTLPAVPPRKQGQFVVLFAGNLGRFQALDTVIEAAHILKGQLGIQFHFMGDGVARAALEKRAGELVGSTVHFLPYVPPAEAFTEMERADLGLVTLDSRVTRFAYPSKTMTYLSAGCRVLVAIDEDCELTRTVRKHDLGVWCRRNRPDQLAETIRLEAARPDLESGRTRMKEFARQHFGKSVLLNRWVELFRYLEAEFKRGHEITRVTGIKA